MYLNVWKFMNVKFRRIVSSRFWMIWVCLFLCNVWCVYVSVMLEVSSSVVLMVGIGYGFIVVNGVIVLVGLVFGYSVLKLGYSSLLFRLLSYGMVIVWV